MRAQRRQTAGLATLAVGATDAHVLQDFLAGKLNLTRRAAKAIIDARGVWVNRRCVWIARYALKPGDEVSVSRNSIERLSIRVIGHSRGEGRDPNAQMPSRSNASPRHIRILWQNEDYLAADKPAGVLSCDDPRSAEAILRAQEGIPTLEAVHRLDRDTTGCLLFAKSHAARLAAVEVFKTRRVAKTYHAIATGRFRFAHQRIEEPLDGESALTRVTREAVGDVASFLRVTIETGRTNQIRRHLASVRAPIVGDRVFGLKSARDPRLMQVPRQMLHASTLALPDPMRRGAEIRVHSPLPADFRAALRLFGMGKGRKS